MADSPREPKRQCLGAEPLFQAFKAQLDAKHDRRERVVKLSRDTTTESKRVIFQLHRVSGAAADPDSRERILADAEAKLDRLRADKLKALANELAGQDPWEYRRAYCLGLQEYAEAYSFLVYLRHGRLLRYAELRDQLSPLMVSPFDYLLGVCDLSGELMRLALNCGAKGDRRTPRSALDFLQDLLSCCQTVRVSGPEFFVKDFNFKLGTMRQSVEKVEKMCYDQLVRHMELPESAPAAAHS